MAENFIIRELKIINIIKETEFAKTFLLQPMGNWYPVYQAGQFVTLVFYTKHGEKRRSYSISSSPALNEPLRITVKKVENGEFSRLLLSNAKTGDILLCAGINGLFLLPSTIDEYKQYFFIAGGSGISPCFSLLKTLLATAGSKVVLIYSNKSREDCIFYDQLKTLEQEYRGRFRVHFLFSNIYDIYGSRLSNWLLQHLLAIYLEVPPLQARFYLCGPFEFMRMAQITLLNIVPASNILKENFSNLPRLVIPIPPDTSPHRVTVRINAKQHEFVVKYPMTILAAAKQQQISLPYSCEAGRCGSCVATCTKGKTWMAYNEVLLDEEIASGRVLLCQAFPVGGDVEISF